MIGLGWRLLLLAIGGGSGYALAYWYAYGPSLDPTAAPAIEVPAPPGSGSGLAGGPSRPEPVECEPQAARANAAPEPEAELRQAVTDTLPPWDSSLEPQTPTEWYRAFATEPRDEAWAAAAEGRIGNLIAAQSGTRGLRTEFLRCASRYCVVAGYAAASSAFDSCEIGGWIGAAAMFRGELRYSCIDRESDGTRRFVVFVESEGGA